MASNASIAAVTLDKIIERGEEKIGMVQVRKPGAGELRGLNLVDLGQLKVDALIELIPRISIPSLTKAEVMDLDMADLLAFGAEIAGFLLQKQQRMDALVQ